MGVEEILYIGMALGAILGIAVGFIYFNTFRFVSILRQSTRKNYGIVYFTTKGNAMFPVIKNFNKDTIRTHKGIWFFRAGSIYRQVSKEHTDSSGVTEADIVPIFVKPKGRFSFFKKEMQFDARKIHSIQPDEIDFRQGVPVVFLDIDDMIPKKLVKEELEKEPASRNPYQIEATLGKEITAARLEALNRTKKDIQRLVIIVAVLVVMSIAISFLSWDNTNKIGAMVYNLTLKIPG